MTGGELLLVAAPAVPLLGAAGTLLTRRFPGVPSTVALVSAVLGALVAVGLLLVAPPWREAGDSVAVDLPWADLLGSRLRLGWDGITAPLVVLTAVLVLLCVLYLRWTSDGHDPVTGHRHSPPGTTRHPRCWPLCCSSAPAPSPPSSRATCCCSSSRSRPSWCRCGSWSPGSATNRGPAGGARRRRRPLRRSDALRPLHRHRLGRDAHRPRAAAVRTGTTDMLELARWLPISTPAPRRRSPCSCWWVSASRCRCGRCTRGCRPPTRSRPRWGPCCWPACCSSSAATASCGWWPGWCRTASRAGRCRWRRSASSACSGADWCASWSATSSGWSPSRPWPTWGSWRWASRPGRPRGCRARSSSASRTASSPACCSSSSGC